MRKIPYLVLSVFLMVLLSGCPSPFVGIGKTALVSIQTGLNLSDSRALGVSDVSQFRLVISAADIDTIEATFSEASLQIRVPAGDARFFSLKAMNNEGVVLYEGSTTADLKSDEKVNVSLKMNRIMFTVTFDTMGGSVRESIKVASAESFTIPQEEPTLSKYVFGGWFKDKACTQAWDFAKDVVLADLTLYAKWNEPVKLEVSSFGLDGITVETLIHGPFIIINSPGGTTLSSVTPLVIHTGRRAVLVGETDTGTATENELPLSGPVNLENQYKLVLYGSDDNKVEYFLGTVVDQVLLSGTANMPTGTESGMFLSPVKNQINEGMSSGDGYMISPHWVAFVPRSVVNVDYWVYLVNPDQEFSSDGIAEGLSRIKKPLSAQASSRSNLSISAEEMDTVYALALVYDMDTQIPVVYYETAGANFVLPAKTPDGASIIQWHRINTDNENEILETLSSGASYVMKPEKLVFVAELESVASDIQVSCTSVTANGASNSVTTTNITLTFDVDPQGLSATNISLAGATLVSLNGSGLSRTLEISGITVPDGEYVQIDISNPAGYVFSGFPLGVQVFKAPTNIQVSCTGATPNGAPNSVTTTNITLTFDVDPQGLSAANISLTGATLVSLSGSGLSRTLEISGITVPNGEYVQIDVTNPAGYIITGFPLEVQVFKAPVTVLCTSATANGASNSITTTNITLTFDIDPQGLSAADISLTGATLVSLNGSGLTRTLEIAGITVPDGEYVQIDITNPAGYIITGFPLEVQVFKAPVTVQCISATPNGAPNSVTTTTITLTFDVDPLALSSANISLTGAMLVGLSGSGLTRTLVISGITVPDGGYVQITIVNPVGYIITGTPPEVQVFKAPVPVQCISATRNGTPGTVSTTEITLTFDIDPATLSGANISLVGATLVNMTGSGTIRILTISGITVPDSTDITINITNPIGYVFNENSLAVMVYRAP